MENSPIVVLVTAGSAEEATAIAQTLVGAEVAACTNLVGPIRSIYRWDGVVEDGEEWLLVIKSVAPAFDRLAALVRQEHSYETPEIIALPISQGFPAYLRWLATSVSVA